MLDRVSPSTHIVPMDKRDDLIDELRERIRQLEDILVDRDWQPDPRLVLSRSGRMILGLLMKKAVASKADLTTLLYGGRAEADLPVDENKVVEVHMYYLRNRLAPFGIRVHVAWTVGYMISPEDKARLLAGPLDPVPGFDRTAPKKTRPKSTGRERAPKGQGRWSL